MGLIDEFFGEMCKTFRENMVGEKYRHFKGNIYKVLDIAVQTENQEVLVIYYRIDEEAMVYARPISMFMSEVDRSKYPYVTQRMRFEKIEGQTKEFNWDAFKRDKMIAVHCRTEEEAKDFCKQMHEQGMSWLFGSSYLEDTRYEIYCSKTCYDGAGGMADYDFCLSNGCKILEWSDYIDKEFTKVESKR